MRTDHMNNATLSTFAILATVGSVASAGSLDIEVGVEDLVTIADQDFDLSTFESATTHTDYIASLERSQGELIVEHDELGSGALSTDVSLEPIEMLPVDLEEQEMVGALLDEQQGSGIAVKVLRSVFQTASLSVPAPGGATLAIGGLLVMARRRR
jgi:hypothetical protein